MRRKLLLLAVLFFSLPLLLYWGQFKHLYWFHDDWELIDGWSRAGSAWIWCPMAENLSPVFKLLWIAAVGILKGSYSAMIVLLWVTHLSIVGLLAWVLARSGFPNDATAIAVITLGLSWTNIETLGWATQWSSLLCTLFLMIAWGAFSSRKRVLPGVAVLGFVASLASELSFSRGVLSGIVLGAFLLGLGRRRYAVALGASSCMLLALYWRVLSTYPNFHGIDIPKLTAMARWGFTFELLNPLYDLVSFPHKTVGLTALVSFGALKLAVMIAGWLSSNAAQRRVLRPLIVLEFGTAVLLTAGRYTTGDIGVVSSRYQYISLLCFGAFLGLVIFRIASVRPTPRGQSAVMIAFALAWVGLLGFPWKRHLEIWSNQRGIEVRAALASAPDGERFGLPSITAGRARELIRAYHLH
jgi:hypothetical protein